MSEGHSFCLFRSQQIRSQQVVDNKVDTTVDLADFEEERKAC